MKRVKEDLSVTHFLNVDLDLVSNVDLQPLVDAFGERVLALYCDRVGRRYHASLETRRPTRGADSTIRELCAEVRALPPRVRRLWKQATRRDFNVGIQAKAKPLSCQFDIESATVKEVAALGARIVITIYSPDIRPIA